MLSRPDPPRGRPRLCGLRSEVAMREQVKQAGGKWNRSRKVWELRYDHVIALKLEARVVEEKASISRYQR